MWTIPLRMRWVKNRQACWVQRLLCKTSWKCTRGLKSYRTFLGECGIWLLLNNPFPSHFPQWPYQSALVYRAHLPHSQLMALLPVLPRKESMSLSNSHSHKLTSIFKKSWVPVLRIRGCIPSLIQSFPFTPDPIPLSLWRLFQAWPKSFPKTKQQKSNHQLLLIATLHERGLQQSFLLAQTQSFLSPPNSDLCPPYPSFYTLFLCLDMTWHPYSVWIVSMSSRG